MLLTLNHCVDSVTNTVIQIKSYDNAWNGNISSIIPGDMEQDLVMNMNKLFETVEDLKCKIQKTQFGPTKVNLLQ